MPLTATSQFAQVVENNLERIVAARVIMALPAGTYSDFTWTVRSIALDGNVNTDLPDDVRTQDGTSTVGGTLTLAGMLRPTTGLPDETKTAWWLFNPDNPASPLYRTDIRDSVIVTIDIADVTTAAGTGVQTLEYVRRLTGTITSYRVGHLDGTVEFDVVDTPPGWGNVPGTPGVVTAPPYNAGLTNEFPMDQIIRSMQGASSWPAQRAQCLLAVGFRNTLQPEVGTISPTASSGFAQPLPAFAPGAMGSALRGMTFQPASFATFVYGLASTVGTSLFVEFWVNGFDSSSFLSIAFGPAGTPNGVTVSVDSTKVVLTVQSPGGGAASDSQTFPLNGGSHYVSVAFALPAVGSTACSATVRVDSATWTTTALTWPVARSSAAITNCFLQQNGFTSGVHNGTVEALQVTTETAPVSNYGFVPKFICDPSLNRLITVPAIDKGTAAWDELQTIAASELGYIRRRPDGVIRFTNRINLRTATIGRTVSSKVSLLALNTSVPPKVIYNRFQVGYTDWNFKTATTVYDASVNKSIIKLVARKPFSFVRYLADGVLAASLDTGISPLPDGQNPANGQSWYRAALDRYGNGEHPGLTGVTVTAIAPNAVRVTGRNNGPDAYLVSSTAHGDLTVGTAALWIGGTTASSSDEVTVETVFGAGDKLLALDSNAYRQYPEEAAAVGQFLGAQLTVASRDFTDVSVVPDVRIEAADKIHLQWPEKAIDDYATVWGWSLDIEFPPAGQSGGSFAQNLDITPLGPPGAWLGGIAGRSEGGITTYGY